MSSLSSGDDVVSEATDTSPPSLVPAEDDEEEDSDCRALSQESNSAMHSIHQLLSRIPREFLPRLNTFLKSYVKFISTSVNKDKGIKFLQYALWLASRFYQKDSKGRQGLTKLASELMLARYAIRLLEFPVALEAALNGSWTSPSKTYSKTFKVIGDVLSWSMMLYYLTEHGAYCHWKAPDWLAKGRSGEIMSAWSCRAWTLYIAAELVQNALQCKEMINNVNDQEVTGSRKDTEDSKSALKKVQLQFARNGLFLLPAIQYSLPNWDSKPWLPVDFINFLYWLESIVCVYQATS